MNKVFLIGNVGKEPEITEKFAKFSLATTNYKKETQWHSIVVFGKLIGVCDYIKKGSKICVVGQIEHNNYEKDGVKKSFTSVIANEIELIDSKPKLEDDYNEPF